MQVRIVRDTVRQIRALAEIASIDRLLGERYETQKHAEQPLDILRRQLASALSRLVAEEQALSDAKFARRPGLESETDAALRVAQRREEVRRLRALVVAEDARVAALRVKLIDEVMDLDRRRTRLMLNVSTKNRARYFRLVQMGVTQPIVDIDGGACGGCGAVVARSVVNDVRRLRLINRCPSCRRMIYLTELVAQEPPEEVTTVREERA